MSRRFQFSLGRLFTSTTVVGAAAATYAAATRAERVRIRGEWHAPKGHVGTDGVRRHPKDPSPLLHVTEVNGARLGKEVVFHSAFVEPAPQSVRIKPRPGEAWEAEGFEVGGFSGLPDWAIGEVYGDAIPAMAGYQSGFRFVMRFVYIAGSNGKKSVISK